MENRILAQRYRLISKLGHGGMGSVWTAEHVELGTQIAVKLMDPTLADSSEGVRRFKREAQAAVSLDSPNIVRVFDYGIDQGTPYIAMELLSGESLAQRLLRVHRIDIGALAGIYLQIGKALSKAHQRGITHRDLKPANIILLRDEDGDIAKIIDFGIAKRAHLPSQEASGVQTITGALMGTPFYMSPEQASGSKAVDFRTDIWALGVIAYECILGERPYQSDSIGNLVLQICTEAPRIPSSVGEVPNGFDEWYARSTARSPSHRFPSARDAVIALCQIAEGRRNLDWRASRATPKDQATGPAASCLTADSYVPVHCGGSTAMTMPDAEHKQAWRHRIGVRSGGLLAVLSVAAAIGAWSRYEHVADRNASQSTSVPKPEPLLSVSAAQAEPSGATRGSSSGLLSVPERNASADGMDHSAEGASNSPRWSTISASPAGQDYRQTASVRKDAARRGRKEPSRDSQNTRIPVPTDVPTMTFPAVSPEPKIPKSENVFKTRDG